MRKSTKNSGRKEIKKQAKSRTEKGRFAKGVSGNPRGVKKGTKQTKTLIKEELGLNSTKDIPKVILKWTRRLYKKSNGQFTKEIQVFRELIKYAPKTNINVDQSFEEFLREQTGADNDN